MVILCHLHFLHWWVSVRTKCPVKSNGCLVKVKLWSFGPVIVQEIWICDGILIRFQGLLNFFSGRYITLCYSLYRIQGFKQEQKQEVFFASSKFHMHQVEVESFVSWSLNFIPVTFPPTPLLRLVQGLLDGMCHSCTLGKQVWCTLHSIRKCYWGQKVSTEALLQNPHLHHVIVLNRGGLQGGPKAKKLMSSSIGITIANPIIFSVL